MEKKSNQSESLENLILKLSCPTKKQSIPTETINVPFSTDKQTLSFLSYHLPQ